jgi:hypothetical protein
MFWRFRELVKSDFIFVMFVISFVCPSFRPLGRMEHFGSN